MTSLIKMTIFTTNLICYTIRSLVQLLDCRSNRYNMNYLEKENFIYYLEIICLISLNISS